MRIFLFFLKLLKNISDFISMLTPENMVYYIEADERMISMKPPYPTPHINAKPDDFAKTVLMPGDPLRSKYVAESFLDRALLVNDVRGIQGYTGEFEGIRVSVMASGMGMPSMGIYSYELFNFFDVDNIIRIGSCGAVKQGIEVMEIVLAMGACTNSAFVKSFSLPGDFAPIADYDLLRLCKNQADNMGLKAHVGNVFSSDTFYNDEDSNSENKSSRFLWAKMGVLAVEMESAALYMNAARAGKRALSVLTVSDSLITGESLSSNERQSSFSNMITLALKTAKLLV